MGSSESWSAVLVCFAVKEEATEFRKTLSSLTGFGNPEILITGMGRKNSERMLVRRLEKSAPNLVFTCGFAGALDPQLEIGDVLFEADINGGLAEKLKASGAAPGKFCCALRVATTALEKTVLRQNTGADAVEMESGVIREICRGKRIPSATIRVISDTANQDLPLDFNRLMTSKQTISFPKLAFALARAPGKIPKLLELQRNTRLAAQELAEVLNKLLRSLRYGGG